MLRVTLRCLQDERREQINIGSGGNTRVNFFGIELRVINSFFLMQFWTVFYVNRVGIGLVLNLKGIADKMLMTVYLLQFCVIQ